MPATHLRTDDELGAQIVSCQTKRARSFFLMYTPYTNEIVPPSPPLRVCLTS